VLGEKADHPGDPSPGTDVTSAVENREVGIAEVWEAELGHAAALALAVPTPSTSPGGSRAGWAQLRQFRINGPDIADRNFAFMPDAGPES
jgi:hypothetical protein